MQSSFLKEGDECSEHFCIYFFFCALLGKSENSGLVWFQAFFQFYLKLKQTDLRDQEKMPGHH